MILTILLLQTTSGPPDTTFPDWRKPASARAKAAAGKVDSARPNADAEGAEWLVVKEHPAMGRDSTTVIEVAGNRIAAAAIWPFDNIVRPSLRLVLKPIHAAVDYSENTKVVDRGLRLVHPTGDEDIWLYPVTTLDGTESSRWGLVFMNNDLASRGWALRAAGALSVAQDASGSVQLRTARYTPLQVAASGSVSGGTSRAVGIRAPGQVSLGDRTATGQVSDLRFQQGAALSTRGPLKGSGIFASYDRIWHRTGLPGRIDQEFPDPLEGPWFRVGDRGTRGEETDQILGAGVSWNDQNLAGAPTSGGPVQARYWRGWSRGGGDFQGFEVSANRCFLLGNERYVYRTEDLRPYLDLDPREIVKVLDPTTLRERMTQRKILVVGFRYTHIDELQPDRPVSYFSFPTMGGDAPARGYPSGYLMDHTVAGMSLEYRWPIWKYLDGVSFAEIAWTSPGFLIQDADRLAPGAGAGFRARLDRLFLFRGYLAWGRSGATYALTTSSEF